MHLFCTKFTKASAWKPEVVYVISDIFYIYQSSSHAFEKVSREMATVACLPRCMCKVVR